MSNLVGVDRQRVTIAVIHYHLRGYPEACLKALGADDPAPDTEYLLVQGEDEAALGAVLPAVRRVRVGRGDRATAKNLAIAEARGEFIQLVTADTLPGAGAVSALREFLESRQEDAVVSAQLLLENGRQRRTDFPLPTLLREANIFCGAWCRFLSAMRPLWHSDPLPADGPPRHARALHATFMMARREVFEKVGPFSEGYRFACEDLEWCCRAAKMHIGRFVLPGAHVFKLAPQQGGALSPAVRVAMERSFRRLMDSTCGRACGAAYRGLRAAKYFCVWIPLVALGAVHGGGSPFLRNEEAALRALLGLSKVGDDLSDDVESHVRWENVF